MQWTNPRAGRTTALMAAYTALLGACLGMLLSACGGSSAPAAPSPPTATQFSVTTSATATAGTAVSFTVTALDASKSVVKSYLGTVHFTSTDSQAGLPANSTLTNGTGTFQASSVQGLSSVELFDPAIGSFALAGNMKEGRSEHTATLLANGEVLITGGVIQLGSTKTSLATAEMSNIGVDLGTVTLSPKTMGFSCHFGSAHRQVVRRLSPQP
jgi:hypothetical protein